LQDFFYRLSFQRERFKSIYLKHGFSFIPYLLHPKSRGRISLASKDIYDAPVIEPNYFSHPDDFKTLLVAIRLAMKLGASPPFAKHGSRLFGAANPSCREGMNQICALTRKH
jgi:choline dehydrogenase-like flavoprotein